MKYLRPLIIGAGAALLLQLSSSLPAAENDEMVAERIHSPLPLYTFDWAETWPRSFRSGDDFGCTSRVVFGDWRFTPIQATNVERNTGNASPIMAFFIVLRSCELPTNETNWRKPNGNMASLFSWERPAKA